MVHIKVTTIIMGTIIYTSVWRGRATQKKAMHADPTKDARREEYIAMTCAYETEIGCNLVWMIFVAVTYKCLFPLTNKN